MPVQCDSSWLEVNFPLQVIFQQGDKPLCPVLWASKENRANEIIREVGAAVSQWHKIAVQYGFGKRKIDRMSSAFEHEDGEKARNAN